jgi:hypothetical protein
MKVFVIRAITGIAPSPKGAILDVAEMSKTSVRIELRR